MASELVLALGAAPGSRCAGETAGIDRLTVFATWLTSGPTTGDTLWTTVATIGVASLVGLVTDVIRMLFDVDLTTGEKCWANVLAGTTDPA